MLTDVSTGNIVKSMNDMGSTNGTQMLEYQANKLQDLIHDMNNCCQERIYLEAQVFGLPPSEIKCLLLFDGHRYLTGVEVAARMEVAKSRATVIIDNLVRRGLVQRSPDPNDARVKLVSLTPDGQRKVREIEDFVFHLHRQLLGRIDSGQRSAVISSLEVLRSAMESVKARMQIKT